MLLVLVLTAEDNGIAGGQIDLGGNPPIDLRNQADGIYTVRVQTANGVMTKNIMVSNK